MTKKQKFWLAAFLGLFVVPEVLWSPVGNSFYEMAQTSNIGGTTPFRTNFLTNSDNVNTLSAILFVQVIGLLLSGAYLLVVRRYLYSAYIAWVGAGMCALLALLTFFFFGLSVSLRDIGF